MPTRQKLYCAVALLGMFLATDFPALVAQDPQQGWKTNARTNAVVLATVESSETLTTFSFKNVSGRVISAFAVSFGANSRNRTNRYQDWFGAEAAGFASGDIYRITLGTQEASTYTGRTLQIAAVIFADGAGEGSQSHLDFLNSRRLGQMLETERIKNILIAPGAQRQDDGGMKILAERIGRLPESDDEALASTDGTSLPGVTVPELRLAHADSIPGFLSGVRMTREDASGMVDRLRQLPVSSSDPGALTRAVVLFRLQQMYEEKSSRHHEFLNHSRGARHQ